MSFGRTEIFISGIIYEYGKGRQTEYNRNVFYYITVTNLTDYLLALPVHIKNVDCWVIWLLVKNGGNSLNWHFIQEATIQGTGSYRLPEKNGIRTVNLYLMLDYITKRELLQILEE